MATRRLTGLGVMLALLAAAPAAAEVVLPPGFTTHVYVTGEGFEGGSERGIPGIPATSTLALDQAGTLYLARLGARFRQGEAQDYSPLYRIPVGGARLTAETESRFFYGPPLPNPQVAAVRGRGEVFVTTYDRDRRIGALYRIVDGRATLFAGGTPPDGGSPLLRQPDGAAVDAGGHVYVADREQGVVVRLDPRGKVVSPEFVRVTRPRMLSFDEGGQLWIASDGTAAAPFMDGQGQLWRASPDGDTSLIVQGPLPSAIARSPGGALFFAQRRAGKVFVVTPEGRLIEFASMSQGTILRSLAFAPVTPDTRQAGIGGDLFLVVISRSVWALNEVIRVSGPFDEFARRESSQ
jgi:DNA-binding beta-propeller fold protein YncE